MAQELMGKRFLIIFCLFKSFLIKNPLSVTLKRPLRFLLGACSNLFNQAKLDCKLTFINGYIHPTRVQTYSTNPDCKLTKRLDPSKRNTIDLSLLNLEQDLNLDFKLFSLFKAFQFVTQIARCLKFQFARCLKFNLILNIGRCLKFEFKFARCFRFKFKF